jgi:hypothetical protein
VTPLLLPYALNILILIPVGLTTLLGGSAAMRLVFEGKFPESAGVRTILGSLWTAILIGSVLGLFEPVAMAPLLLIQVLYKAIWLVVFVLPLVARRRAGEVPRGVAGTFLFIVLTYPWVIPWASVFGR